MDAARNMSTDGKTALFPSGFRVNRMVLQRHDGSEEAERDITPLVTEFSFIESIYSPTVVAKFSVKDAANFLETFPLIGHEKLVIELTRIEHETGNEKEVTLNMVVTEYPLFSKPENQPNQSVFKFSAVGEHAYIASLSEISRKFKDNLLTNIETILKEDLKIPTDKIKKGEKKINVSARGVFPSMKPFQAMEFLRARCCDDVGAPLYIFQTIDGNINLKTQTDFTSAPEPYGIYRDEKFFKQETYSLGDYKERAGRLLNITSNLKMGRIFQAQAGAFASEQDYVDLSTKTFGTNPYKYGIESSTITGNKPFSEQFKVDDKPLTEYPQAHIDRVSLSSLAYGDSVSNTNQARVDHEQKQRAFLENFETISHDIEIYGDYYFNPGKKITLKIPKAIDPNAESAEDPAEAEDQILSGDYIVTSVTHRFRNGEYFIDARVKKDSFNVKLEAS